MSSTMLWDEYVKSNIAKFRNAWKALPEAERKIAEESEETFCYSLNEPCQVAVIFFGEPYPISFVILHNKKYPDMKTIVFENTPVGDFSTELLQGSELFELLGRKEEDIETLVKRIMNTIYSTMEETRWISSANRLKFTNGALIFFREDIRVSAKYRLSDTLHGIIDLLVTRIVKEKQREKIEEAVGDIKRDAREIPVRELRTKIIEATERLEGEIKQLDKKLKEEVNGMRQLIGTSERFLEWKAFSSDIEHLKTTHVPREVFEAKMGELNTRIDSLTEIKKAYDNILAQQMEFMKQQADVMKQQSSFIKWIKHATILLPIAVISVPIIEIISIIVRHFLNIP